MKRTITTMLMAAGICLTASAQIKTPLMGWSSWNTYGVNISDTLIMRQAPPRLTMLACRQSR